MVHLPFLTLLKIVLALEPESYKALKAIVHKHIMRLKCRLGKYGGNPLSR
jgi:hypothetical protein